MRGLARFLLWVGLMSWFAKTYRCGLLVGAIAAGAYAGCGSDEDAGAAERGNSKGPDGDDDGASGDGPIQLDAATRLPDGGVILPPEVEVGLSFETPQAGLTSVYVPNPATNRVAVVNATTFAIESLPVGGRPTYAATVPGQDVALVLNVASRDAALLRTEAGKTSVTELEVGHDANAIAIAPGGLHAVIYLNADASGAMAQSYQDLTIVNLAPTLPLGQKRAQRVSVGFRPRGVQFTSDGRQAFVITEDGISILDFAALAEAPSIARLVGLGDTLSDGQSVDVQVTPDGAFALARRSGESTLRLVNLADGSIETLALGSLFSSTGDAGVPPAELDAGASDGGATAGAEPELTDLDVSPDGSFAMAVLRDRGALVRIPLPDGFRDPSTIDVRTVVDQLIGSVTLSASGSLAVAYTTAVAQEAILLIDLAGDAAPRGVRLRKAVRAVALSDDGARLLVLHAPLDIPAPSNQDERIDASEGYSLVDTTTGFAKLQLTDARVRQRDLLITPNGAQLFALIRNDAREVRQLDVADLSSFQVTNTQLSQPPSSIGFVPSASPAGARVFVGHTSPGGMITFFAADSGEKVQEVAGFEIASRIRQ